MGRLNVHRSRHPLPPALLPSDASEEGLKIQDKFDRGIKILIYLLIEPDSTLFYLITQDTAHSIASSMKLK